LQLELHCLMTDAEPVNDVIQINARATS
jgi:hypothetical protein